LRAWETSHTSFAALRYSEDGKEESVTETRREFVQGIKGKISGL